MELPNNGEKKIPVMYLLPPNESSSAGHRFQIIELRVKGAREKLCIFKTTQAIAKATGCSPQTEDKALLLNTTST